MDGEIIKVDNTAGELVDITDDIVASAERRIEHIKKITTLALKNTNENDWVDQNGKPYLTASGAEKIARLFGVSWKILKNEKIITEDEKNKFYFYQVTGVFSLAGKNDNVEAVGTCSSKDQFFAKVSGNWKPTSEIDETNIMKAAYSNCIANGITRLLGIRNLTWEQVKLGGVNVDKVAKVKYASGGAGGGLISEAQRKRLWAMCKQAGILEDTLKRHIEEKYKITTTKEIKKSDYDAICKWVEEQSEGVGV